MSSKKTATNKPLPTFLRPKPIKVVTRKVLEKIADGIYNPKTRHYLNLCVGELQDGPDPAHQKRHMHCGLGELYFVVTGKQPEETGVSEDSVVKEIVNRSTIHEVEKIAKKKIGQLGLSAELTDSLLLAVDDHDFEEEFRQLLDSIPTENDNGNEDTEGFKARAKRIADVLRQAAALLPR